MTTKRKQQFDYPIGKLFLHGENHVRLMAKEITWTEGKANANNPPCFGCYFFRGKECDNPCDPNTTRYACVGSRRKDGKSVKFMEVRKDEMIWD
jgi:hypothetical protein